MIWSGRHHGPPLFNYCIFVACIVTAAGIPGGVLGSDDSLRSALEAISDKIGETPQRVVYLQPRGNIVYCFTQKNDLIIYTFIIYYYLSSLSYIGRYVIFLHPYIYIYIGIASEKNVTNRYLVGIYLHTNFNYYSIQNNRLVPRYI